MNERATSAENGRLAILLGRMKNLSRLPSEESIDEQTKTKRKRKRKRRENEIVHRSIEEKRKECSEKDWRDRIERHEDCKDSNLNLPNDERDK